jgi:hypothetical protein
MGILATYTESGSVKRFFLCSLILALLSPLAAFAGGLEIFLSNVNVEARADLPGFSAKVSAQFGVPIPRVQAVIGSVREPADAFMIFQLGQMSGQPTERVLHTYKSGKGKGWGAMAKELGIKPGSAQFHALKSGDLSFTGHPGGGQGSAPGKGKGHGKGHNK